MEIDEVSSLRKFLYRNDRLVGPIGDIISGLGPKLSSSNCCIYRVPKKINVNPAAYTPQLVSVGPLHYGQEAPGNMGTQKLQYLEYFLAKVEPAVSLGELVAYIREKENIIRECYAESIDLSSDRLDLFRDRLDFYADRLVIYTDRFVYMVLVDSAFIIILFIRTYEKEADDFFGSTLDNPGTEYEKEADDFFGSTLDNPGTEYEKEADDFFRSTLDNPRPVQQDLILFENQLPFFILEGIYNLAFKGMEKMPTFRDLTLKYFSNYNKHNKCFLENTKHFTDLIRYFQLPEHQIQMHNPRDSIIELGTGNEIAESLYSATELQEVGVKFQMSREKPMLDIYFRKGTVVMPHLTIDRTTEFFFLNLIAMEELLYPRDAQICDYIVLMDYLINTSKDVELLVQKKIILNRLGDHHAVANLFNTLGREISNVRRNHYYRGLFIKLNKYGEVPYHKWEATLRLEYFKTPFRAASTIAAIILLVLTAIQTVYSVIGK